MIRTLTAATAAALALASAASPAHAAAVVAFGTFAATPGCVASSNVADQGLICQDSRIFTVGSTSFTALGFANGFTNPTELTLKIEPRNAFDESGLGENALGLTFCSDSSTCEIKGTAAVAVISNGAPIDAVVGSVQAGENFKLFTGDTLAGMTEVASGTGGTSSCPADAGPLTCHLTFAPARIIGLESGGAGDVLLTEVSFRPAAVSEPSTLAVLGVGLLGLGMLRRRRV